MVLFGLCLFIGPEVTNSYTVETILTPGCHEKIASESLRAVRLVELATAGPLAADRNERALIEDLQFNADADMQDLGGATLLVAVRDNDLKGRSSDDLTELSLVHGNPDNQDEHCLRSKDQDEPGGSEAAVNSCRTFIRGRIAEALDGLDASGSPDLTNRTSLPLHLSLRGNVDALLPTYYVRIGQAIHAVEDSFTHTYRTPDGMKITVVLNYIDEADGTLLESRDGPGHATAMDVCNDPDDLRTLRRKLATEASVAVLRTTLDPLKTKDEKMAAVDGILDTYLSYSPGCTFDNNWCDAPERSYKDKGTGLFGCASGGGGVFGGILILVIALGMRFFRRKTVTCMLGVLILAGMITFGAKNAHAADPNQTSTELAVEPVDKHEPPPPTTSPVAEPGPSDPSKGAWGAYVGTSASLNNAAFAGQLGIRRRMSTHWTLGWDVEWNPWVSLNGSKFVRSGVFNTYSTIILRWPLAYENFNLRTTMNLGISYLLMDLYGAPKGSIGIFGAISPLGLEWKVSRTFLLIINPLSLAIPAPQLKNVPMYYPQYRFSIGFAILAG